MPPKREKIHYSYFSTNFCDNLQRQRPVSLLSGAKKTELAYLVWFRFYNFLNTKNLKICEKNFLTANRSKKLKNYFTNISGMNKDILEIPTDLSSVGSGL